MKSTSNWNFAAHKNAYRLWFEYLKVARSSTKKEVKAALIVSAPFYKPWEMDKASKFDPWWRDHRHLFEEKYAVREMRHGDMPVDPNALVLEIPLTQSPTVLTKRARELIQIASDRAQKTQSKGKTKPTAYYHLTEGTEPKFNAVREMLSVYRDVYLKDPRQRGSELLEAVQKYYSGRKNKRWAKVPMQFDDDGSNIDKIRAMRNLRRYIQKAEKVVLNVARGQFPGKY